VNHELLILDPKASSSMLEPLLALDILMADPIRWAPQLADRPVGGVRVLPSSRLRTVLYAWANERGIPCATATPDQDWLSSVGGVLIFDRETRAEAGELLSAFGVPLIFFDLEQGAFLPLDSAELSPAILSVASPNFSSSVLEVGEG
jgi:hypothetical protein